MNRRGLGLREDRGRGRRGRHLLGVFWARGASVTVAAGLLFLGACASSGAPKPATVTYTPMPSEDAVQSGAPARSAPADDKHDGGAASESSGSSERSTSP